MLQRVLRKGVVVDLTIQPTNTRINIMSEIEQSALDNVRALQRPGSPDLLGRIIDIFVTQTPEGVHAIVTALAANDLDTVRNTAHSLKSSAAYVGASQFSTRMADLERAAREEHLSACQDLVQGLEEHAQRVIDELQSLSSQEKAA